MSTLTVDQRLACHNLSASIGAKIEEIVNWPGRYGDMQREFYGSLQQMIDDLLFGEVDKDDMAELVPFVIYESLKDASDIPGSDGFVTINNSKNIQRFKEAFGYQIGAGAAIMTDIAETLREPTDDGDSDAIAR